MNYELKTLVSENEEVSTKIAENYFHNKGYKLMPFDDYDSKEFGINCSTWAVFIPDNSSDNYSSNDSMSYNFDNSGSLCISLEEELEHMRRIYKDGFKVRSEEEDWRISEGLYNEKEKDPYKDLMI